MTEADKILFLWDSGKSIEAIVEAGYKRKYVQRVVYDATKADDEFDPVVIRAGSVRLLEAIQQAGLAAV